MPEDIYGELRVITTTREQLVNKRKNAKYMGMSVMDEYFPEYKKIYKNIFSEGSIKLLKTHPFQKK
ncbi:IS110 family transposase [Thermosipho melanesiensis]|uniref:IS110 family transposase n=1 Tax=Thermosipho melanesiensis TaxID=46541 RepID=UPI0000ED35A0|nr:IS110 family transposase [Thermosipho melanesiensis]